MSVTFICINPQLNYLFQNHAQKVKTTRGKLRKGFTSKTGTRSAAGSGFAVAMRS